MKSTLIKRLLYSFLFVIIISCLLMVTPRIHGALFPERPPMGYHFLSTTYLSVMIGLEDLMNLAPEVPSDIEEIKNIEYKNIDGKSLQLDIIKSKDLNERAPLLVFIHGGGWKKRSRADYLVYQLAFAKKGYVTATVSYRFGPYPECVEDISDVVQWFYKNSDRYGYDPDRIALIGGSAGGHLSMLGAYGWSEKNRPTDSTSTESHRIKAVVNIYGPVDFTTEYSRNQPIINDFMNVSYQEAPELYKEASPIQYLDKNDPPTLILQGTSDELVPGSQPDQLRAKLDSLGIPYMDYRLPLWIHAMDMMERPNLFVQKKMNDFFEKHLK